ncbi:hypothetical protein RU07_11715 [Agrobacterium tumefaciens]|uniref:Uncharacterized protein n=1 Tax=Agrobacterium tumefaciens TaxID=358 RepID=A0A0D0KVN9_AGRTU|nr:hypothetical protein RU07_11715 [Agrobacterium tumefaciens]
MKLWKKIQIGFTEVCSTIAGAIVGGILTQFAFPAVTPYLDLWAYEYTGWTPVPAHFAVFADEGESASVTIPGDFLDTNRLFCGWSRKCVMKTVVFDSNKPPSEWKLDYGSDAATKAVFVSDWSGNVTAALIDRETNAASFVQLKKRTANGFIGFGYGCFRVGNDADRSFGRYFAYWGSLAEAISEIKDPTALTPDAVDQQFRAMFYDINAVADAAAQPNVACPLLAEPAPTS